MTTQIPINIVSDTVCPWCFIGKRRLEKALSAYKETHPDVQFKISWHPFYLDPTVKETEDKLARYERKFGKARMAQMIPYMQRIGEAEGIHFQYGGKTGNTRNSHRLIAEAGARGGDLQDKLVNALFHAYFEVNDDITSKEVLAKIAKDVGLFETEEEGVKFLESDARGSEVDKEVLLYQYGQGINGVPHFIIDDQAEVGGAQDPAVFLQIFDQILKSRKAGVKIDGDACLPDGSNC